MTAAVLDSREELATVRRVALRGGEIQPVYLRITNRSDRPIRLYLLAINPNYFTPLEAAAANHFSIFKRLATFGILGLIYLPLLAVFIPFKLFAAYRANHRMDAVFQTAAFRLRPIPPGESAEGFVFTPYDAGTKIVRICLHSAGNTLAHAMASGAVAAPAGTVRLPAGNASPDSAPGDDDIGVPTDQLVSDYTFTIEVPGITVDHAHRDFSEICPPESTVACDVAALAERLRDMPPTTTNHLGTRHGDPVEPGRDWRVRNDSDRVRSALGRKRNDHTGHVLENGDGAFARLAIPLLAGEPSLSVRPQPGCRAAEDSSFDQRSAAPAALAFAAEVSEFSGVGRADQPRYRRAIHAANLEPDDASNQSRRGRISRLCDRRSLGRGARSSRGVCRRSRRLHAGIAAQESLRRSVFTDGKRGGSADLRKARPKPRIVLWG